MRKRITIGLITTVVIGIGVYALSGRGTIEYHKEAYLNGYRSGRLTIWILEHVPAGWATAYRNRKEERVAFHRQALIRAGYFGHRVYEISNEEQQQVFGYLPWALSNEGITFDWHAHPTMRFGEVAYPIVAISSDGSSASVVALANEMERIDRLIRTVDVPKARGWRMRKRGGRVRKPALPSPRPVGIRRLAPAACRSALK